eukprot:4652412-Pyramimonas_sp.AAC.1
MQILEVTILLRQSGQKRTHLHPVQDTSARTEVTNVQVQVEQHGDVLSSALARATKNQTATTTKGTTRPTSRIPCAEILPSRPARQQSYAASYGGSRSCR